MTNEELIEDVRLFLCKQFIWSKTKELPKDECLSEARTIVAITRSVRDSVIQFPSDSEKFDAFKKAWADYPSQDNEGYEPDRGGFKAGWFSCFQWLKSRMMDSKPSTINHEMPSDPIRALENAYDSLSEKERPDKFMPLKRAFMAIIRSQPRTVQPLSDVELDEAFDQVVTDPAERGGSRPMFKKAMESVRRADIGGAESDEQI